MINQQIEIYTHLIKQVDVRFITCKNQHNIGLQSNIQGLELNKSSHDALPTNQCLAQTIADHLLIEQYVNKKI